MTLNSLFNKYGSDKGDATPEGHNYGPFYETWLQNEAPKILVEFGVREGASLRAWRERFPEARIIGVDLFAEVPMHEIEGVKLIKGNQLDHELLYHIRNDINPDVVIDDCSHNSRDQIVTFYSLFRQGMKYFVEDTQCMDEEFYRQGLPRNMCLDWHPQAFKDCGSPIIVLTC